MIHYRHDIEQARAPFNWSLTKRMLTYLVRRKTTLLAGTCLSLIVAVASLAQPIIVMEAIRQGIGSGDARILASLGITYVLVTAVANVAMGLSIWMLSVAGQEVLYTLRTDLFRKLQSLSLNYYDRTNSGSSPRFLFRFQVRRTSSGPRPSICAPVPARRPATAWCAPDGQPVPSPRNKSAWLLGTPHRR